MANLPLVYTASVLAFKQDFATVNLAATYTQVTAGVAASDITALLVSTGASTATVIEIATGAAGAEVVQASVAHHTTIIIPLYIPKGTRIAIRSHTGTINTGQISINGLTARV
jgi:hypothetical protein